MIGRKFVIHSIIKIDHFFFCFQSITHFSYISGTFKFRKLDLVREGYNPALVSDPLYFYNSSSGGYTRLDTCLYDDIVSMKCRL